jgi:hypothetical protein
MDLQKWDWVMRVPITLRLDAALLGVARLEAERDSRSLSDCIEVALRSCLESAANIASVSTDETSAPESELVEVRPRGETID